MRERAILSILLGAAFGQVLGGGLQLIEGDAHDPCPPGHREERQVGVLPLFYGSDGLDRDPQAGRQHGLRPLELLSAGLQKLDHGLGFRIHLGSGL